MDFGVAATGLLTGLMVGVTGMGGGALTMPLLTLVFGVPPLAAVSSDLVASAVMKPLGAAVHLRRRTVQPKLVGWLCLGSLPCAAVGSLLAGSLGSGAESVLKEIVGGAVLLAAITLFGRMLLSRRSSTSDGTRVRPVPTVLLGAVAGLVVGTTSVGSGSIIIVVLLLLNRGLSSARLVGTDLVQAVPLVLVSAIGHLFAGDVHIGLVGSLLTGSIPGVLVGSLISAKVPDRPVRLALGGMLVTTGLMMLGSDVLPGVVAGLLVVLLGAVIPPLRSAMSSRRAPAANDREGGSGVSDDHELAARLARRAGQRLLEVREGSDLEPRALGDAGDAAAHELLVDALAQERPDDPVLSEHGIAGPERVAGERVWIVDPLDGTREFTEAGRSDWAVHVALAEGHRVIASAVALPAQDLVLDTGEPPAQPTHGLVRPRIAVSRSRPPEFVAQIAEEIGAELVPMGSAGAKITAVVLGHVDAYLHAGGQYEWDSAAPVGIAQAAGLHTSRLDGTELVYDRPDPWLPDLLVCRRELAVDLLAALPDPLERSR
ncbi:TSUP family transporter [Saccharopolyspora tripterygii]